jgi:hypothetical protein
MAGLQLVGVPVWLLPLDANRGWLLISLSLTTLPLWSAAPEARYDFRWR